MNVEPRTTRLWLDALLRSGLCLNYDPTVTSIGQATQIEISPAGRQHLTWGLENREYLGCMADVTPLLDREVLEGLKGDGTPKPKGW